MAKVIKGRGRGGRLGIRTLNLKVPSGFALKRGVWKCMVFFEGKGYRGLLHYGPRPTFGEEKDSLEVLIGESLGRKVGKIEVKIGRWLREVKKFASVEDFLRQVKKDKEELKGRCF